MRKILYLGVIALVMAGCYPKGPTYVSDLDLVLTNYSDTFNFAGQQTYYLFDTVKTVDSEGGRSSQYSAEIINEIHENMANLGYVSLELPAIASADLIITATSWSETSTNFYYSGYDYWGWGYPGYGYGYGWGYPYYGWTYAYSYSTGTILIEMSYPGGINDDQQYVPLVWMGVVNGLLEGNSGDIRQRIATNIDQAFEQSPYILSNP